MSPEPDDASLVAMARAHYRPAAAATDADLARAWKAARDRTARTRPFPRRALGADVALAAAVVTLVVMRAPGQRDANLPDPAYGIEALVRPASLVEDMTLLGAVALPPDYEVMLAPFADAPAAEPGGAG